jgi:hypothetical protein
MLTDRARARDDVIELQRMWASEPENFKPFYVEALEDALADAMMPALATPISDLPVQPVGPPPEGPATDLLQLMNAVNLANAQM